MAVLGLLLSFITWGAAGCACGGTDGRRPRTRITDAAPGHSSPSHTVAKPQLSLAPLAPFAPFAPFRVATFNAGLALGVLPLARERAMLVVPALARLPVDLLCVQELWQKADWDSLRTRTSSTLPGSVRPAPHVFEGDAHCSTSEARPVFSCVRRHCAGASQASLGACAAMKCGHLAFGVSAPCAACLTRDPLRSIEQIEVECVRHAPARTTPTIERTRSAAHAYVYGGSYGLGLLTRAELLQTSFLHLTSEQLARGVLYAKVRHTPSIGDLHVFCTHLTANVASVPYPVRRGSWRAEHARQVGELLGFIDHHVPAGEAAILLGDLNTGPAALPKIRGRLAEQYERILAHGFENPYFQEAARNCSFCYSNPMNGGTADYGTLIDHVLLHGSIRSLAAKRILDEPIDFSVRGKSVRSAYSDHYGIALELGRAAD